MAAIAIAGAGLAGRLLAWTLSRAGHAVEVFDASSGPAPAFDAQGAAAFSAAGMLSPLAEQEQGGAEIAALGWRSLALWPDIVASLSGTAPDSTPVSRSSSRSSPAPGPVPLRIEGSLLLSHRADLGAAERALRRMPGAEPLDMDALRTLEPMLAPGLRGWLLPREGLIAPVPAMAALHAGATAAAARWHWSRPVDQVVPGALHFADGGHWHGDWAIDARGLGARPPQPLRGVRGEIVTLSLPGHGLRRPVRLLHPRHRVYLVPRSDAEIVVGASEIESEDRSPVSLRSAVELMAAAQSVLPALSEARIVRLDRHLRPALPDNLPFLHHEPGLLRINGLYRHGWLLAPALVERLLDTAGLAAPFLEHSP
ncbi:FAD-dependent oxidoreductase [Mitsuaria sp. CC2]|uniref:FAD-dependent oxidoreductase n=1 Tax=Mitsuaria sp. CC2 TaxID=3029186 RepID=UPI003B8B83B6